MLKTLKYKLMIIVAALTMTATPMLLPAVASATDLCNGNAVGSGVNQGVNNAIGATTSPDNCSGESATTGVENIARKVIELFSIIVGIISVAMIIYAGFRYITSGGESGSVSNAKNTLIYAIIGLVIVVLAQLIVHFVLNAAAGVSSTSGGL